MLIFIKLSDNWPDITHLLLWNLFKILAQLTKIINSVKYIFEKKYFELTLRLFKSVPKARDDWKYCHTKVFFSLCHSTFSFQLYTNLESPGKEECPSKSYLVQIGLCHFLIANDVKVPSQLKAVLFLVWWAWAV